MRPGGSGFAHHTEFFLDGDLHVSCFHLEFFGGPYQHTDYGAILLVISLSQPLPVEHRGDKHGGSGFS